MTKEDGGFVTTYNWGNGDTTAIFDLRSPVDVNQDTSGQASQGKAAHRSPSATDTTPTIYEGGWDITPTNPVSASQKNTLTPVANLSDAAMVQTLGAPDDVVAEFAAQDALDGTSTVATATGAKHAPMIPATGISASVKKPAATSASGKELYNRTCVGNPFDGGRGNVYGCFNQYIAHRNGSDWYMTDRFYSSASMHDHAIFNPDELTGLQQGVSYPAGNTMIDWRPTRSFDEDCKTQTVTISVFGQSYTTSFSKCAALSGFHFLSKWTFLTKWDGHGSGPHDGARDTSGVDEVHNPPNASPEEDIHLHYWYD